MKTIRIGVKSFYDVRPVSDAEIANLPAGSVLTKLANGGSAVRELRERSAVTRIDLPEEVEARLVSDAAAASRSKSRVQLIAEHIENAVMPHHSESEHFVSISVAGDPQLESYLAARLQVPVVQPNEQYTAAMLANNDTVPAFQVDQHGVESQPAHDETLVTE